MFLRHYFLRFSAFTSNYLQRFYNSIYRPLVLLSCCGQVDVVDHAVALQSMTLREIYNYESVRSVLCTTLAIFEIDVEPTLQTTFACLKSRIETVNKLSMYSN